MLSTGSRSNRQRLEVKRKCQLHCNTRAKKDRRSKQIVNIARFRKKLDREGRLRCEVCGWAPSEYLLKFFVHGRLIQIHHLLPISCGGTDDEENLLILCPNHHAIADAFGMVLAKRGESPELRTRQGLIDFLRRLDD